MVAKINEERVEPHQDRTSDIFRRADNRFATDEMRRATMSEYRAFGAETGREDGIGEHDAIFRQADVLIQRMWEIPAHSSVGRAAKVRVLIRHIMVDNWDAADEGLDWDVSLCRRLLLEFSGMSEAELRAALV